MLEMGSNQNDSSESDMIVDDTLVFHESLNDDQKKKLQEYYEYLNDSYNIILDIMQNGYSNQQLLKHPKPNLNELFNPTNKKSRKLTGKKLDEYLRTKIVNQNDLNQVSMPNISPTDSKITLEKLEEHLKNGYKCVDNKQNQLFCVYLDYGNCLIAAYKIFEDKKEAGDIKGTWKKWLKNKVGIVDSYARKLRTISNQLNSYPKFNDLSISFTEIYNKRKEIKKMLEIPEIANSWK
jgi:hypothetical protein